MARAILGQDGTLFALQMTRGSGTIVTNMGETIHDSADNFAFDAALDAPRTVSTDAALGTSIALPKTLGTSARRIAFGAAGKMLVGAAIGITVYELYGCAKNRDPGCALEVGFDLYTFGGYSVGKTFLYTGAATMQVGEWIGEQQSQKVINNMNQQMYEGMNPGRSYQKDMNKDPFD
jgi:hypothetical protein